MKQKSTAPVPEEIIELQRQFNEFRSTHRPRTKLPENLWQGAVELVTTRTYDALNRLLTRSYSDGTRGVTYAYDTVRLGTVSSVANSVSTTAYTAYDALSRVTGSSQTPAGQSNPFAFNYGYNRQGALSSEVRPSGRTVTYGFDAAGRVNGVTGTVATTPTNYASSVTYASNGGVAQMTFGNSVVETTSYSANRQQATGVTAASGAGTLLSLGYSYCATYAATCSNNNGNVWQQTMARPAGSWTQAYGYSDGLNRLNSVAETGIGTGWSEGYTYDAFGNRWVSSTNEQTLTAETPTASSWFGSNNRIIGWGYDSAGNITSVSSMQRMFTYDAENRQTSAAINGAGAAYGYDGQGQRVTKTAGGTTTTYVYDAPGDLVAEYGGASNSDTGTLYLTVDALGSTRLATDVNGAQKLCYDYLPFGQEIGAGVDGRPGNCFTTDSLDTKFTGQKRDSETGLDYFGARYFSGAQGRFGGADAPFNDQDPSDPQSWNLFSYGRNNPLVNVDPTGQACVHSADAIGQKILDDDGGGCRELTDSGNTATVNGSTDPFLALANGIARAGAVTAPRGIAAFYASRAPSNVNCNTKLPNGQTVGQYVNNARAQLQAVVDRQNALAPAGDVNPFSIYTQFASIAKGGGPIDFKNIFAGQASRELLGNAGNFAYYAIGEGYIPTTALDLGAGAYGLYGAAVGRFPTSFLTGRFFSDDSARLMRSPGLAANGCPQ